MHGWDGECRVDSGSDQIPAGWSGWELGMDQNPKRKADKDYKQRTKDALHLKPADTTFVFVTARRWAQKAEWVNERRAEKHWADVRAYDAVEHGLPGSKRSPGPRPASARSALKL
jgi:hypothetical protein